MKIVVMGCGRVGSQTSLLLADRGHSVTVIAEIPAAAVAIRLIATGADDPTSHPP
jgi:Trk K+ transport system NAD-binding subunit